MSLKQRRETVHGRIEGQYLQYDQTISMIKNFVKLFIIDQGAVDTLSEDEWSKKIKAAIYKRELDERMSKGEKISMANQAIPQNEKSGDEGLRRLDSVHLNKLTSLAFKGKTESDKQETETEEISPIGKFKEMNLEAIDEIDSFCTDSSYVPSPDMIKNSPCLRAVN